MGLAEQFLKMELSEAQRELTYCKTVMRNAITELEDGDTQAAIETLQQIVGSKEPVKG